MGGRKQDCPHPKKWGDMFPPSPPGICAHGQRDRMAGRAYVVDVMLLLAVDVTEDVVLSVA